MNTSSYVLSCIMHTFKVPDIFSKTLHLFSCPSLETYVEGIIKNHLHNICFCWGIRNLMMHVELMPINLHQNLCVIVYINSMVHRFLNILNEMLFVLFFVFVFFLSPISRYSSLTFQIVS